MHEYVKLAQMLFLIDYLLSLDVIAEYSGNNQTAGNRWNIKCVEIVYE